MPAWIRDILSLFEEAVAELPAGPEDGGECLLGYLEAILSAEEEERREYRRAIERLLSIFVEQAPMNDRLSRGLLQRTLARQPSVRTLHHLIEQLAASRTRPDHGEDTPPRGIEGTTNRTDEEGVMDETNGFEHPNREGRPVNLQDVSKPAETPFVDQRRHVRPSPEPGPSRSARREADDIRPTLSFGLHSLQKTLERQLSDVIEQNRNFGTLLNVEQTTLENLGNVAEIDTLRQILGNEIDRLLKGQGLLQRKLENALKYVRILETEGDELSHQLARAHSLSLTDELTDLPNRRAFVRTLEDEVARVQRYGYPLSLALLDLDHFKEINDRYGHAAGDEVLKCFSRSALSAFRHHDMLARYGGEEFAILLPNTDITGALKAVQKVRSLTRKTQCTIEPGRELTLPTFSGGIVPYQPGETPSEFIERADQALYQAKEAGRDRVVTGGSGRSLGPKVSARASNEQPA